MSKTEIMRSVTFSVALEVAPAASGARLCFLCRASATGPMLAFAVSTGGACFGIVVCDACLEQVGYVPKEAAP